MTTLTARKNVKVRLSDGFGKIKTSFECIDGDRYFYVCTHEKTGDVQACTCSDWRDRVRMRIENPDCIHAQAVREFVQTQA